MMWLYQRHHPDHLLGLLLIRTSSVSNMAVLSRPGQILAFELRSAVKFDLREAIPPHAPSLAPAEAVAASRAG